MMNVYDLVRLAGVIINGAYLYNNLNELYEINVYNVFILGCLSISIMYASLFSIQCFLLILEKYLPENVATKILSVSKYTFFSTNRNDETDIKNIYMHSILSTGINCLFILSNTKLFPEYLHFICTPLFITFISTIYITIKHNLNVSNIISTIIMRYVLISLALNLPNLVIMSFIQCYVITKMSEMSTSKINNVIIFLISNIGFIFLGIHFYNNPFSLQLLDENEIMNYLVIMFSLLVCLNILSISGLIESNSDNDPKNKISKQLKTETCISFIKVMAEEALFLPLYNGWGWGVGMLTTKILLSILFGLLHISGRNWKSGLYIGVITFIGFQFNFSLINRMIGHYIYDIILLQLC